MDTITPDERSRIMALIRSKDSRPEMLVRRLVHAMGYRFRLHDRKLPGCPDLVFRGRRSVIFVHGCFWHRHAGCGRARMPKTRQEFWVPKLEGNRRRDELNRRKLRRAGWRVLTVWECQTKNIALLEAKIGRFFEAEG